jgi:hypothetical protein
MTLCVVNSSLGAEWFYPVIDPYRTAGEGPYHYGYVFAWDAVEVTVTRNFSLSRCKMRVEIISTLAETKQIQAFNFYNNTWNDMIDSDPTGALTSMTITKWKAGQDCSAGTDTVVLARAGQFGPKLMYTFGTVDFWDFWGGCTVRFTWVADTDYNRRAWAPSGALTPPPTYPAVSLPDGTLMRNGAGTGVSVVYGGTDFAADPGYLGVMAVDTSAATARAILEPDRRALLGGLGAIDRQLLAGAIAFTPLPPIPADFTLVREWNRPEVYVVYGGAKFRIPDPATLFSLGFDWSMVRVIPAGGTSKLLDMPIDRTLLKEQNDPRVFVVEVVNNQQVLRLATPGVMEARCLPWRHVRVVPDTTLSTLPQGPDLDLP